jgi:hypothetical protein
MSTNTLYIPKKLYVGFQNRSDTFTGKLAYVIYEDHSGKKRKQKSWEGWRDKNIPVVEVDNAPTPNFTLNKGVQRSREWFGTGRSMVRVWDPRDFEFEITVDNLLNVLMHADVSKRDITEPCVYAWQGTNLVLLPTNSVEYQESIKHTAKQSLKVSARDLVVGHTYSIKQDSTTTVVYLGRFDRYETVTVYDEAVQTRYNWQRHIKGYEHKKKAKKHVFINPETKMVDVREPSTLIAACVSDEVHPELATLMDAYYKTGESQPAAGVTLIPCNYSAGDWYEVADNKFVKVRIVDKYIRDGGYHAKPLYTGKFHFSVEVSQYGKYDAAANTFVVSYQTEIGHSSYYDRKYQTHNNTGISNSDPDVQQLLGDLTQAYIATRPSEQEINEKHNGSYDTDYYGHAKEQTKKAAEEVMKRHKTGRPALILADGKVSETHICY